MAKLNKEIVLEEAINIGNRLHLDHVTPALIAKNLGVTTPAIYKHYKNKEALKRELSLKALTALEKAFVSVAFGEDSTQAIHNISHELRRFSLKSPCYFHAIQKAPPKNDKEWTEKSYAVVSLIEKSLRKKLPQEAERIHFIRFMRSAISGFIECELGGGFGLKFSVDTSFKKTVENILLILNSN